MPKWHNISGIIILNRSCDIARAAINRAFFLLLQKRGGTGRDKQCRVLGPALSLRNDMSYKLVKVTTQLNMPTSAAFHAGSADEDC